MFSVFEILNLKVTSRVNCFYFFTEKNSHEKRKINKAVSEARTYYFFWL